jgi:hypothetical protein
MLGGWRGDFDAEGSSARRAGGSSGGVDLPEARGSFSCSLSSAAVIEDATPSSGPFGVEDGARGKTRWGRNSLAGSWCAIPLSSLMVAACLDGRFPPSIILPRLEKEMCSTKSAKSSPSGADALVRFGESAGRAPSQGLCSSPFRGGAMVTRGELVAVLTPLGDRVGVWSLRASATTWGCCFFFRRFVDFIDEPDVRKLKERREKIDEEETFSGKSGGGVVGDVGDTVLASDSPGECRGMLDWLSLLVPSKLLPLLLDSVCSDVGDDDLIRKGGTRRAGINLDLRIELIFS